MATVEERMKILKMIEEGKITAEDGANSRVLFPLIAHVNLSLHVLCHDRIGLDVLAGGFLVRLHGLENLGRRVFSVIGRIDESLRALALGSTHLC